MLEDRLTQIDLRFTKEFRWAAPPAAGIRGLQPAQCRDGYADDPDVREQRLDVAQAEWDRSRAALQVQRAVQFLERRTVEWCRFRLSAISLLG